MPREIYDKTLKYFHAFGPKEIFESVNDKLTSWATSIQILDFKLRHNEEFLEQYVTLTEDDVVRNEVIEREQQLFLELVSLAGKIKDTFVPLGRPGRRPRLFEL